MSALIQALNNEHEMRKDNESLCKGNNALFEKVILHSIIICSSRVLFAG